MDGIRFKRARFNFLLLVSLTSIYPDFRKLNEFIAVSINDLELFIGKFFSLGWVALFGNEYF